MKVLLLIDLQNDFLPGGALPVTEGDQVIPIVNELVNMPFDLIVATKDWHPQDHGSFATSHAGKKPGDHVTLGGIDQVLWPVHCVQGSWGSEFAKGWDAAKVDHVVYKGTNPSMDSYSAFFDNGHLNSTGLDDYLKSKNTQELYIAGLATDYCVRFSVLDALELGYPTTLVVDACRGVNLQPHDVQNALTQLQAAGAKLIRFNQLI